MSRIDSINAKLERADEHIRDLEDGVRAFLFSVPPPYEFGIKINPQTREHTYYLVGIRDIPADVSIVMGDAVHNLRCALDHLAYQLVESAGNKPTRDTSFPVFENAARYNAGRSGKTKGMRQSAIDMIDAAKPYNGGNEPLWCLHRLDNIDKHRLLIAIYSKPIGHSIPPSTLEVLKENYAGSYPGKPFPYPHGGLLVQAPAVVLPLKAGDVLLTVPESEVQENMKFSFDLALSEPGVVESKPILPTVHSLANTVKNLIADFAGLL